MMIKFVGFVNEKPLCVELRAVRHLLRDRTYARSCGRQSNMNVLFMTSVLLAISLIANGANDPESKKPPSKTVPAEEEVKKQDAPTAAKIPSTDAKSTSIVAKTPSTAAEVPGTSNNATKTTSAKGDGKGKGKPATAPIEGTTMNRKPFSDQIVNDSPAVDDIAAKNKAKPVPTNKDDTMNTDEIESKKKTEAKAMPEPKETSTNANGKGTQNETSRTLMTAMLGILTVLVKYGV